MDDFDLFEYASRPVANDEKYPAAEDFKSQLQDCLDDVKYDGTFSAFHSHATYTNPGLNLLNYGTVGLPLADRDAKGIAAICKQSPFGKGDHTVVDTSVRKTWEIDASEFVCGNPGWTSFLASLVDRVGKDLGVQGEFRAEPYKLLLYEEGAFFKAHRDSEKVPGMFGTLVVCLPSEHSGGEVRLLHGKEERILETSPTSAFDLSVLAWYSDVSHEVCPVTAGYRLVLTYNLVQDQTVPKQRATVLDESHARLERLLVSWKTDYPNLAKLVYPLEHQYTQASASLRNLKGHDAAKGKYIDRLCSKNGFYWFLARLTKEDEEEEYEEEDSYSLDHIVTPGGTAFDLKLEIDVEDEVLADIEMLYESRDADSEDEGEFTGNESMPSRLRYHDTV